MLFCSLTKSLVRCGRLHRRPVRGTAFFLSTLRTMAVTLDGSRYSILDRHNEIGGLGFFEDAQFCFLSCFSPGPWAGHGELQSCPMDRPRPTWRRQLAAQHSFFSSAFSFKVLTWKKSSENKHNNFSSRKENVPKDENKRCLVVLFFSC